MSERRQPPDQHPVPDARSHETIEDVLGRLVQRLGTRANVSAVFGQPIEREGVSIIPVAKVQWGLGGGSGPAPGDTGLGTGEGGGGGMEVAPLGYIEIAAGLAEFRRIVDPAAALVLAPVLQSFLAIAAGDSPRDLPAPAAGPPGRVVWPGGGGRRGAEAATEPCPICSAENRVAAAFCRACGIRLAGQCPGCGQPAGAGDRFCDACGAALAPHAGADGPTSRPSPAPRQKAGGSGTPPGSGSSRRSGPGAG